MVALGDCKYVRTPSQSSQNRTPLLPHTHTFFTLSSYQEKTTQTRRSPNLAKGVSALVLKREAEKARVSSRSPTELLVHMTRETDTHVTVVLTLQPTGSAVRTQIMLCMQDSWASHMHTHSHTTHACTHIHEHERTGTRTHTHHEDFVERDVQE